MSNKLEHYEIVNNFKSRKLKDYTLAEGTIMRNQEYVSDGHFLIKQKYENKFLRQIATSDRKPDMLSVIPSVESFNAVFEIENSIKIVNGKVCVFLKTTNKSECGIKALVDTKYLSLILELLQSEYIEITGIVADGIYAGNEYSPLRPIAFQDKSTKEVLAILMCVKQ